MALSELYKEIKLLSNKFKPGGVSDVIHSSSVSGRKRQEAGDSLKCVHSQSSLIHLNRVSRIFNNVSLPTQQHSWEKYLRSPFYNVLTEDDVSTKTSWTSERYYARDRTDTVKNDDF